MTLPHPPRHAHSLASPALPGTLFALTLLLVNSVPAQQSQSQATTPPDRKAAADSRNPSPAKPDAPPSFLGDTERFTRFGGWGSVGAGIGQFGFARSMLIMLPPVQKELELSEEQIQKIRDWLEIMRTRGEEFGRNLRDQARENGQDLNPAAQADLPLPARILQFTTMMNQLSTLARENETGIARILTRSQRQRLDQIALQMEGISAILRPDVATRLNLSPAQRERIALILTQSQNQQMAVWIEQSVAMAANRNRDRTRDREPGREPNANPGANTTTSPSAIRQNRRNAASAPDAASQSDTPQSTGQPQPDRSSAAPNDPDDNLSTPPTTQDNQPQDPARTHRFRQFQKQFADIRDQTDQIQDRTAHQILKILTSRQRSNLDKLLGEPFDPQAINNLARPSRASSPSNPDPNPRPPHEDPAL